MVLLHVLEARKSHEALLIVCRRIIGATFARCARGKQKATDDLLAELAAAIPGRRGRPAGGGRAPQFGGEPIPVHDMLVQEMERIYRDDGEPRYLDGGALRLLQQGRAAFARYRLRDYRAFEAGRSTMLFPWRGDRVMNALLLQLHTREIKALRTNLYLVLPSTSLARARQILDQIARANSIDPMPLLPHIENLVLEKHHHHLASERLMADFASSQLDFPGANTVAAELADALRAAPPVPSRS